jgi:hypothetical protein
VTRDKKISEEVTAHHHQVELSKVDAKTTIEKGKIMDHIALRSGDTSELAAANQAYARATLLGGINRFFRAAEIKEIKNIKETKQWRHIPVCHDDGSVRPCGSFADFCTFGLGYSKSFVYEQLKDFDTFGEALDGLRRMGLERKDLRLLRQSPDGSLEEIKVAAERQDKDALLELIDDLSARHAKEKEKLDQEKQALADKVQHLESERQVDQRLLEDKEKKLNELERELRRDLTADQAAKKRAERDELLKSELTDKSLSSISTLNDLARVVEKILDLEDRTDHLEESLYAELRGVFRHALLLGRQYDILPEQLLGIPVPDLADFDRVIEGDPV